MKKILLLTDVNFWLKDAGHRVRIDALVSYLVRHTLLTIVFVGVCSRQKTEELEKVLDCRLVVLENETVLSPDHYGKKLTAFLKTNNFDAVLIEYIHNSHFLNYLIDDAMLILDLHDIISERSEEFKKFNYNGHIYEISRDLENEIMQAFDYLIAICEPDKNNLCKNVNSDRVLLCPHPVSIVPHLTRDNATEIAFIGSEYLPNKDGIIHFLDHYWPLVPKEYNVRLNIYGNVGKTIGIPLPEKVNICGYVQDIEEVYRQSDIIINPVRFGAGLKIKNIEALAHGLPLITTSHGARGIERGAEAGAFAIADAPEEFTKLIRKLLDDMTFRQEMSDKAIHFIEVYFSEEKCFSPLLSALNLGSVL